MSVPFNYKPGGQDAFFNMMQVKTLLATGWIYHNPSLGAPGTLNQLDFPLPDSLHFVMMRGVGFFGGNFGRVINLYYLLTFPLIALSMLYAALWTGLSRPAAIVVSQFAAFLPFHLMRGEMHLTLSSYFLVPLTLPAILHLARGKRLGRLWIVAVPTFALLGTSNVYHVAFAAFFLGLAGILAIARLETRAWRSCGEAAVLIVLMGVTFAAQLIPTIVHQHRAGSNPMVVNRSPADADSFGLKIAQLILPVPGHRLSHLAQLRKVYAEDFLPAEESESAALGTIGSIGFLLLLVRGVLGLRRGTASAEDERSQTLDTLAMLTLAAVLMATVGGFNSIFSLLISSVFRSSTRMSLEIALFALLAIGIFADRFIQQPRPRIILWAFLLIFGLLDEIPATVVPNYAQNAADFRSDAQFVSQIEHRVPSGAMIFQLPFVFYPEWPAMHEMSDYELFRGYLHSSSLRWSYGAMKGRAASIWQSKTSELPVGDMVDEVRRNGFAGIYVDRNGYADDAFTGQLTASLGPPLVSDDHRLLFFPFSEAASPTRPSSARND